MRFDKLTVKGQEGGQAAQSLADQQSHQAMEPEHLLLALIQQQEGVVGPVLAKLGARPEAIARAGAAGRILNRHGATADAIYRALAEVRGTQRVTDPNPEDKYQALQRYSRDLTDLARKGKLDPVIGRDEEIRRVIQVLSRRTKNNPVLIGEPGVGKTAIVEGLAQRIVA